MLKKLQSTLFINMWLAGLCTIFLYIQCDGGFEQHDTNQEKPSITTNTAKNSNHNNQQRNKKKSKSNQTTKKGGRSAGQPVYTPTKSPNSSAAVSSSVNQPGSFPRQKPPYKSSPANNSLPKIKPAQVTPVEDEQSLQAENTSAEVSRQSLRPTQEMDRLLKQYNTNQERSPIQIANTPKTLQHNKSKEDKKNLKPNQPSKNQGTSVAKNMSKLKTNNIPAITPPSTNQPASSSKQESKKHKKKDFPQQDKPKNANQKPPHKLSPVNNSLAKIKPLQVTSKENLENLRAEIRATEEAGQLLKAAQQMDRLLKMVSRPTLEDLCYALDLNHRAPFVEARKNRPHQLADLIAEYLEIDPQASIICFKTYSWRQLRPYLDYLIAETAADSSYEKRTFQYKSEGKDSNLHYEWFDTHMQSYKYPIAIGGGNHGAEGNRSEKGVWDIYHKEITINNYTQKETESRESFAYHFHGGSLDTDKINPTTFYNLMVRAGFTEEDFEEGKYGFQDKVLVKPIILTKHTPEECNEELRMNVVSTLMQSKHPYVALIFGLQPDVTFTISELYRHKLGQYFAKKFGGTAATIIETQENRLYLCFYNATQNTLDLHGASSEEAFNKLHSFILERYSNFDTECTVITGRGNHVNPNGETGILNKSFKRWAKNELKAYIKSHISMAGNGGYKIVLCKPVKVVLTNQSPEVNLQQLAAAILKADQANNKRLIITHQQDQLESYYAKLLVSLLHELAEKHSFSIEFQFKNVENGMHLSWGVDVQPNDHKQYHTNQEKNSIQLANTPKTLQHNKPKEGKKNSKSNQTTKKEGTPVTKNMYIPKEHTDISPTPSTPVNQSDLFPKQKPKVEKSFKKKDFPQQDNPRNANQKPLHKLNPANNSLPKIKPSQVTSGDDLENLRAEIRAAEETEQFLKAAQQMDRLLKIVNRPTLEDLCYALDLNRKAPFDKVRKNRPHQLAELIAKHLKINPRASTICFKTYSWRQLRPYLDYLIAETAADPNYEERKFKYQVQGPDIIEQYRWLLDHGKAYKYPISIEGGNYGVKGNKSAEGVWDIYHNELTINNYTQKETEARESFAYRFHGGNLNTDLINLKTFYNLMVRAGFTEEDFEEGKYGFQDKILVKPITLSKHTLEECNEELRMNIVSTFMQTKHPHIAFIVGLQPNTTVNINQLYGPELHKYFLEEFKIIPTEIIELQENRLYLCFKDVKQNILDLHGATVGEAFNKLHSFILERYNNFDTECTVITGRGNHVNPNGETGILNKSFKEWAKNELKAYIKRYIPMAGNGGYKITLCKPISIVLANQPFEINLQQVTTAILKANQTNNKRLIITHQQDQPESYYAKLLVDLLQELDEKHSLSIEFQFKNVENGMQLSWEQE